MDAVMLVHVALEVILLVLGALEEKPLQDLSKPEGSCPPFYQGPS